MQCRDVRELADSFLSEELLTETNHEIVRHLDGCPGCRSEIAARRALRASMRGAFATAADLQPRPEFAGELRERLRAAAVATPARPGRSRFGVWWPLAATLVVAAGLGAAFWMRARAGAELARLAAGDHRDCALHFRLAEKPIALDEAVRRFDAAYHAVETFPPDEIRMAGGPARVLERHSCVFEGKRFAHLVLDYRGKIVSLLVTAGGSIAMPRALDPLRTGIRHVDSFTLVSAPAGGHTIFLVGTLEEGELQQLAAAVVQPLAQTLAGA